MNSWKAWFKGLLSAFVSGGAGAAVTGTGIMALDTMHDLSTFKVYGITFLSHGLIGVANYLQKSPLP